MELRSITVETLAAFAQALRAEERCTETIKQYTRSVRQFAAWLAPETVAAGSAGGWKAELLRRGLSPATVNSKLAGLNRFFRFLGWMDCTVKPLRLQRRPGGWESARQVRTAGDDRHRSGGGEHAETDTRRETRWK